MREFKFIASITILISVLFYSCSKDESSSTSSITDDELKAKISENGYVFYKKSIDTLPANGPHSGFIRVRFKNTSSVLNSEGVLPEGASLPEGTVVVKEVYNKKGGSLTMHAIMYKNSKDKNSASGWVWAEYNADGSTAYSVNLKGAGCVACHQVSPTRDFIKIFDAQK